jgi:hypothetical protein
MKLRQAAKAYIDALKSETGEVIQLLEAAIAKMNEIREDARGAKNVTQIMKTQSIVLQETVRVISLEVESFEKSMLNNTTTEISEYVDVPHTLRVLNARNVK